MTIWAFNSVMVLGSKHFCRTRARAGVPLRHPVFHKFGNRLGVDLRIISRYLRHESLRTTEIYLRRRPDENLKRAA
ncbi:MAG: hypothetical protein Q8L00_08780 [Deltaproteobacteria bacterium]|nr:hypothetical protein [Deltaproteobacteria bacterium]